MRDPAASAVRAAGLDVERAKRDADHPEIDAVLKQDVADLEAVGVQKTPTFFVDGREPESFGPEPLYKMILAAIEETKRSS